MADIPRFKRYYLLIISLLFAYGSYAQQSRVVEFEKELDKEMTDVARIKLLKNLSGAYSSVDPVKKFYYANAYRELAEKIGADSMVADAYLDMGISYGIRSKIDSALYYFSLGYSKAKESNYLKGVGRSLVNMGFAYDRLDEDQVALEKYLEALPIFKKIKFPHGINQCYTNIGSLYFDLEQYELARTYFNESLNSNTKTGNEKGISWALYNMGFVSTALGDFSNARNYLDKSLAMRQEMGDFNGIAQTSLALGQLEVNEGNYEKALANYTTAYAINDSLQDRFNQGIVMTSIANLYHKMNDKEAAKQHALEALEVAKSMDSKKLKSDILPLLIKIGSESGDFESAFKYQKQLIAVNDSIGVEKEINHIMLAEFNRMGDQYENLAKDNQIITSQNDSYLKTIFVAAIILGLVVLLVIGLYKRNIERKTTNQLLKKQKLNIEQVLDEVALLNEELNSQMSLVESQNLELSKLDMVKNKLFSILSHDLRSPLATIQMVMSMYREDQLSRDELNGLLNKLEKTVNSSSLFLDNLLEWSKNQLEGFQVNSTTFSIKSLVEENIELVKQQTNLKEISVENHIDENLLVEADPDMVKVAVRNLLSNSIKFCSAGDVISFRSNQKNGEVLISIADTGPGINDEQKLKMFNLESATSEGTLGEKGQKLGLILCKEMVEQNKGSIDFESEIGEGTTFRITLPTA